MDIEWFDTKFAKGELDAIITHPPSSSKIVDRKDIDKLMKEFFYQSEFVLKKKGKIVLCSRDLIEPGKDFSLVSRREAWQGMQQLNISIFEKI
jgi:tRNA G10  N-methylase Trm11